MTSKERAALRAQANSLEPLFQVGKGGVNDALIAQTLDAFRSRELLKLKVLLETAPKPPREIAEEIAAKTQSEVVQGGAQFQTQPRYITANFKSTGSKAGAFSPAFLCIGTNREFFVKAY